LLLGVGEEMTAPTNARMSTAGFMLMGLDLGLVVERNRSLRGGKLRVASLKG
jgi:hypothetical protein